MIIENIEELRGRKEFSLTVNDKRVTVFVHPSKTLLEVLREDLNLIGTKCGCDDTNCGVCTVLMDGAPVKSCTVLIPQAAGHSIMTIEGLEAGPNELHPLQQSFIDHTAIQCGFCTPAMVLTAKALLDENPHASEEEIREGIHGNVCRCTGYKQITEAIMAVRDGEYGDFLKWEEAHKK